MSRALVEGAPGGGQARTAVTSGVIFRSTVPADPASIALVRNAIRSFAETWSAEGWGGEWFDADRAGDLALVYTELLTNAVIHGGGGIDAPVDVHLELGPHGVKGSVTDGGEGFTHLPSDAPRVDGGLGLFIVARLVRTWGIRRTPAGTEVWFDF